MNAHFTAAHFEMSFCPSVEYVSVVRKFVSRIYERLLSDPTVVAQMALATHEMLENAVRYGTDETTYFRVDVEQGDGGAGVKIMTRNCASSEDMAVVERLVAEITGSANPLAYYQEKMLDAADKTEGSGLGLARVRAEAEMQVSCECGDGKISVRAHGNFQLRAKP